MTLIGFLVALIILAIVVYIAKLVIDMLPLPEVAKTIAMLLLGLVALLYILGLFGINTGVNVPALR
jgi:heme A synthase